MNEDAMNGVKSIIDAETRKARKGSGVNWHERFTLFGDIAKLREQKRPADSL
jgi:hypothetical protein